MVKKEFDKNSNKKNENKTRGEIMKEKYDRDESIQKLSIYKVDEKLKEKGYKYDEDGVLIPYTYKNQVNPDCRDIYLHIRRYWTDGCDIRYYWCKNVEGKFYGIEQFERNKLPCEETDDIIIALKKSGIESNLDYDENSFIEFFEQIKKDISSSNCLDVLKDKDFDFWQSIYFGHEPHDSLSVFINRYDLRKIIRSFFDIDYLQVCNDENMINYDLIPCILSKDRNHNARVYKHCYICEDCNPPVKLDQYTLMKEVFGVNTPSEIKDILENDFHDEIDELTMENAIRIANSLREN